MSTRGAAGPALPMSPASADRGHRLGTWSLLMLPFLLVSGALGGFIGFWILSSNDLEGSEPLSVQGTPGWISLIVSTVIFMAPMAVGVVLGAKARRLGERRLGTIGMVVDGLILVAYVALVVGNALTQ